MIHALFVVQCGAKGIDVLSEHHIDGERLNNEYDNLIVFMAIRLTAISAISSTILC